MPKVMKKDNATKMKMGVHKSRSGGLTAKGVAAYRRANPGSKLKTAVTESKPTGKRKLQSSKSFCSRMSGMKKRMNCLALRLQTSPTRKDQQGVEKVEMSLLMKAKKKTKG